MEFIYHTTNIKKVCRQYNKNAGKVKESVTVLDDKKKKKHIKRCTIAV